MAKFDHKIKSRDINYKNKLILEISFLLIIVLIFIGVSFAGGYWSYTSNKANTLSTEEISFTFLESNSVIDITNALPISDNEGKNLNKYFEFAITSTTEAAKKIGYSINIEPIVVETGYTGLNPEDIKVYLTDKTGNILVNPTKLSQLNDFELYNNIHNHISNGTSITSKFVLKAWIDKQVSATNWYSDYENNNIQYQYKFRINVEAIENIS